MYKWRVNIILLLILLIFSMEAEAQLKEVYVVRSTASPCLNVRQHPDVRSDRLDCLVPGTKVTVTGSVPFWRKITFGNNRHGWVAKKFIEPAIAPAVNTDHTLPDSAYLTVHFVDVGQGDAIWIQTYDDGIDGNGIFEGYSIIIDGGPYSSDKSNPFLPYIEKQAYHGAAVEALLVTHPHTDHFKGAESIARNFSVNHYYDPGYPSKLSSYKTFIKTMKGLDDGTPQARHLHIGKENFGSLNWGSELQTEILYSWNGDPQNLLGTGNTEVNNASIVLRVQYGEHVFLFMGDAEGKERDDNASTARYVEKILLETVPEKLKATVLKVAHHGSETSSTWPFIRAVNPDVVIVESGRKKFNGTYLPDYSTLQRYCANNPQVKIYRTDQGDEQSGYTGYGAADGDHITICTNGRGKLQITALEGGQPFTGNFCPH